MKKSKYVCGIRPTAPMMQDINAPFDAHVNYCETGFFVIKGVEKADIEKVDGKPKDLSNGSILRDMRVVKGSINIANPSIQTRELISNLSKVECDVYYLDATNKSVKYITEVLFQPEFKQNNILIKIEKEVIDES